MTGIISTSVKIDHPFTNESVQFTQDRIGELIGTEYSSSHPPHNLPLWWSLHFEKYVCKSVNLTVFNSLHVYSVQ